MGTAGHLVRSAAKARRSAHLTRLVGLHKDGSLLTWIISVGLAFRVAQSLDGLEVDAVGARVQGMEKLTGHLFE